MLEVSEASTLRLLDSSMLHENYFVRLVIAMVEDQQVPGLNMRMRSSVMMKDTEHFQVRRGKHYRVPTSDRENTGIA